VAAAAVVAAAVRCSLPYMTKKMAVFCVADSSQHSSGMLDPTYAAVFSQTPHSTHASTPVLPRHYLM
jgi:hypothetical protein